MSRPITCREAIAKYWPANAQQAAIITLTHENGTEAAGRVSGLNHDGSRDYGCMMLNNKAHFGYNGWTRFDDIYNAEFNVKQALGIYERSGHDFSPWYAVCTPDQVPKFPGIWCK